MASLSSDKPSKTLSRRGFLKLGGVSLWALGMAPWGALPDCDPGRPADLKRLDPNQQGRVLEVNIALYDIPSFSGQKVKYFWRDSIVPITGVTVGDDIPAYNRVWYQIGGEGYAHSGAIQPVRTLVNSPIADIPATGQLAEVTVPFTDARWGAGKDQFFAYRYYYETTHWVTGLEYDSGGEPWYVLLDDKWKYIFYVPATHLRLIPESELAPLSPQVPSQEKRLEVRTAEQVLIAYERNIPVFMARTATGAQFRDGNFETPAGRHMTFAKRPGRHMAAGDIASNGYDLPGVPWICYFTESGIALHGTYWHNDFGKKRSHGCINLTPQAAKWVYRWTMPVVPPTEQEVYETSGTILDII
jgi:lipoprotein-anchoring transpeptidase ErfK/SrfK